MVTPPKKPTNAATSEQQAELQAAAALVLELQEKRRIRLEKRRQRQARQREKEQLAAVHRMQQSIEVMKWCMVIIATIMLGGVVVAVWFLSAVNAEVEKIQAEVEKVQPQVEKIIGEVAVVVDEVERIREGLKNPMQSIGSAFGKELDAKLQDFVGKKLGTDGGE